MVRAAAVSVGSEVPEQSFRGTVHSVFRKTVNFRLEEREWLLAVLTSDDIDLPQAIRLPAGQEQKLSRLQQGQTVTCREQVLRMPEAELEIDFRTAATYVSTVRRLNSGSFSAQARDAWMIVHGLLASRQNDQGAEIRMPGLGVSSTTTALSIYAAEQMRALMLAARRHDAGTAEEAVAALIGLGGGLTPSGDDVLVGFLAACWAMSGADSARMEWTTALGGFIRQESRATNEISRSYLILAADGHFSSPLSSLTSAICSGHGLQETAGAAEKVFETGHTSGMDAATGLLVGLASWNQSLLDDY